MVAFRLAPLQSYYKRIKQDYYQDFEKKRFKGYKSPWLPISDNNVHLLRAGDLVIDSDGIEAPYLIGRYILHNMKGGLLSFHNHEPNDKSLRLVWVDTRRINVSRYLEDASDKEKYYQYSEQAQLILRRLAEIGLKPTEEVRFPLYHETNFDSARNIMINGFDIFIIMERCLYYIGNSFFSASQSIETVKGKGNFHGAILKLLPADNAHPYWVNVNEPIRRNAIFTIMSKEFHKTDNYYSWKTFASELLASAVSMGDCVFIFDSFEDYKPAEIITDY